MYDVRNINILPESSSIKVVPELTQISRVDSQWIVWIAVVGVDEVLSRC